MKALNVSLVREQIRSVASTPTIKYSTGILSGGGQWFAGGVQFVAIVTDADLKLDWLSWFL